ncbi:biotin--[acetyl-CoA-carboxylase] ligase [Autumnicola musiva]|uniref:Biotin--[acetyl-CoA-carboxylase] ligase n=1 Tax=Autumnicola musiva TaxID=3075589 RepID=A0ABU3D2N3_9FLAO|nr:biotin--[acetyl-CoA-carboxylase] ligase [Zunongwangia sp. F117]MDT0675795.1 biotin--[acetyl-CoA-carboxylase] ligase [Zunongwangia sp. F117]
MRIIKVNAINSTNEFVRDFYNGNNKFEPVCVTAYTQTKGKGQRGAGWESNPGENLTFSILYPEVNVAGSNQFLLSAAVALSILDVLGKHNIPNLRVKWPNDIMAANLKICGILIENILKKNTISASIIGIGLNVNQTEFLNLPKAGSLQLVAGKTFNTDKLLEELLNSIERRLQKLTNYLKLEILKEYQSKMFKKDVVSTFQFPDGSHLTGIIRGVSNDGLLKVELEDEVFRVFDLKEIKLLF